MNSPLGTGKTVIFNYQQEDYEQWVKQFASHLNTPSQQDRLQYPGELGEGYAQAKILEEGFSYRLSDYTLNTDVEYQRTPTEKFQLILYFHQFHQFFSHQGFIAGKDQSFNMRNNLRDFHCSI